MVQPKSIRLVTEALVEDPTSVVRGILNKTFAAGYVNLAKNPDTLVAGAVTNDGNNLLLTASVEWPDGSPGLLTITARHSTGAVNAYSITYGSPVTKTFTQPAITRNAAGAPTSVPQIVVS